MNDRNDVVPSKASIPSIELLKLASISRRLEAFDLTLTEEECAVVTSAIAADGEPAGLEAANAAGKAIMRVHPRTDVDDPEAYCLAITAIMSDYPSGVLARVSDPRVGIIRKVKFMPRPAEVADACDAEMARRADLLAKAGLLNRARERKARAAKVEDVQMTDAERAERANHVARMRPHLKTI